MGIAVFQVPQGKPLRTTMKVTDLQIGLSVNEPKRWVAMREEYVANFQQTVKEAVVQKFKDLAVPRSPRVAYNAEQKLTSSDSQRIAKCQEQPVALAVVTSSKTVGGGLTSGPHTKFDFQGTMIGAIVVKCGEYVHSIRVVTPDSQARYEQGEHKFALRPFEYLVRISVRSGHWVDAVQFHTNQRSSPWFGGNGGYSTDELACADGYRICSVYGHKNENVVDLLGVHMCEKKSLIVQIGPVGSGEYDGTQNLRTSPHGVDLGAILVEAGEFVNGITTFTRPQVVDMNLHQLVANGEGGEFWFVLGEGEYITNVEVRAMCWVDAVRFHTNLRSSHWYGGNYGEVHNLQPHAGFKIHGFFGSQGDRFVGSRTP